MKNEKQKKEKNKFNDLTLKELVKKAADLRGELLTLRLNSVTTHIKDYSQIGKLRKDIARVLTFINQKYKNVEAADE